MRPRAFVGAGWACAAAVATACQTAETRPLLEKDLKAAGDVLSASLGLAETRASVRHDAASPTGTLVVVGQQGDALVEIGERRAIESGKFAEVIHDRQRRPDYALVPEREGPAVTWELLEVATKKRLFKVTWSPGPAGVE